MLAVSSESVYIHLYDWKSNRAIRKLECIGDAPGWITAMTFGFDAESLAATDLCGQVYLWVVETGRLLKVWLVFRSTSFPVYRFTGFPIYA